MCKRHCPKFKALNLYFRQIFVFNKIIECQSTVAPVYCEVPGPMLLMSLWIQQL